PDSTDVLQAEAERLARALGVGLSAVLELAREFPVEDDALQEPLPGRSWQFEDRISRAQFRTLCDEILAAGPDLERDRGLSNKPLAEVQERAWRIRKVKRDMKSHVVMAVSSALSLTKKGVLSLVQRLFPEGPSMLAPEKIVSGASVRRLAEDLLSPSSK